MIENKENSLKECGELRSRIGGWLWAYGRGGHLKLSETDVQWIEKYIVSHKLFRVINCEVNNYEHRNIYAYAAEFFSMFLDTPGIPDRVNNLLVYVIGMLKEYDKLQYRASIEPTRVFFIQRWMETCH